MPQECLGQISIVPYLLASLEALANCPAIRFEMWIFYIFFTSSIVQTVLLLKLDQLMICRSVDARWLDYQRVWRSSDQRDGRTAAASQYAIHTRAILIDITVMFLWRISPWLLQSQWFDMRQKSTSWKKVIFFKICLRLFTLLDFNLGLIFCHICVQLNSNQPKRLEAGSHFENPQCGFHICKKKTYGL